MALGGEINEDLSRVGEDLCGNLVTLGLLSPKLGDDDASVGDIMVDVRSGETLASDTGHITPLDVVGVDPIRLLEGPEHPRVGARHLDDLEAASLCVRGVFEDLEVLQADLILGVVLIVTPAEEDGPGLAEACHVVDMPGGVMDQIFSIFDPRSISRVCTTFKLTH